MNVRAITCIIATLLILSCCDNSTANEPEAPKAVSVSGTLPVLHIETADRKPITSRTEYLDASYWLDPMGAADIAPLGSESAPLAMQIRGRGHSSWKGAKKPYKIKLAKKAAMMGMSADRHWALLKPSENTVAGLQLGRLMDMPWTPDFRPVEVVLNGDYAGLYFLTETIRIGSNRVNIYEQKDGETDPELIKGGWLVEVDNYRDECQITVPEHDGVNLTLRYHSPEDLSDAQLRWLTDEFMAINRAVYTADKTSDEWEKYIDVRSMARFFILQEVMDNPDGFHGSFYLHKDLTDDAKWIAGPIWDLVCYNRLKTDYTFRMKVHYGITPHWINDIIKYDSFCTAVESVWREVYPAKLSAIYSYIDSIVLPLGKAWENDCARWGEDPSQTAELRAERIKTALVRNIGWFSCHLPVSPSAASPQSAAPAAAAPVEVFSLQGIRIGEFRSEEEARSCLTEGIYIVGGRKIRIE